MSILNKYSANLKANYKIHNGLLDDQSGVITTATTVSGTTGYWDTGEHGKAFRSMSNTSYLDLGTDSRSAIKAIHETGIFTLVTRIKFTDLTTTSRFLGNSATLANRGFNLYKIGTSGVFTLQRIRNTGNQDIVSVTTKITNYNWHTLIIRGNGTNIKYNIDGGATETAATALSGFESGNAAANMEIGRGAITSAWSSTLQDRFIFLDTEMSDADITTLYAELQAERPIGVQPKRNFVSPSQITTGTGIVGGWNFNISGTTVTDVTGTANLTKVGGCSKEPFLFKNSGVRTDGSTGYLRAAVSDYRIADSQGGISIMFIPNALSVNHELFCSSDEIAANRFLTVRLDSNNKIRVNQQNADTVDAIQGSTTLSKLAPTHFVVNSNGSAYEMFVNNFLETNSIISGTNTGDWFADTANRDNVVFGALVRTTAANFSNVTFLRSRIRSIPFTQAEVTEMYNEMATIPIYYMNLLGDPVSLYTLSAGRYVSDFLIISGTWRIDEDSTGKHLLCVTNGQIKAPLLKAAQYTTRTFTKSGSPTLTKNTNDLQIDAVAGEKIYNIVLTA